MIKSHSPILGKLLLIAALATSAPAAEPATSAAIAAGTAAGVSVGVPLLTRSKIEVKIEKYIKHPKSKNPLNSFPLTHDAACLDAEESVISEAEALELRQKLITVLNATQTPSQTLPDNYRTMHKSYGDATGSFANYIAEYGKLATLFKEAHDSSKDYVEAYDWAARKGLEDAELTYLHKKGIVASDRLTSLLAFKPSKDLIEISDLKVSLAADGTPPPAEREAVEAAKELFRALNEEANTDLRPLSARQGLASVAAVEETVRAIVRNGLTTGVIEGNIATEVYQGLLNHGQYLDQVLQADSKSWALHNNACVYGGTGNNDVIIYMDNMFTPVIKTARFSPDAFIAAQGQFFRSALSTVAGVYGYPMTGQPAATPSAGAGTAAAGTPGVPDPFNLNQQDARRRTFEAKSAAARKAKLDALGRIIVLNKSLDGKADTDAAAQAATMAKELKELAAKLKTNT